MNKIELNSIHHSWNILAHWNSMIINSIYYNVIKIQYFVIRSYCSSIFELIPQYYKDSKHCSFLEIILIYQSLFTHSLIINLYFIKSVVVQITCLHSN